MFSSSSTVLSSSLLKQVTALSWNVPGRRKSVFISVATQEMRSVSGTITQSHSHGTDRGLVVLNMCLAAAEFPAAAFKS